MRRVIIISIVLILALCAVLAGPKIVRKLTNVLTVPGMNKVELGLGTYPRIDETGLTESQKAIVTLTRQEHAAQADYTKYTQGNEEAWCADFASWIMNEADVQYTNLHSGSWRIPGTLTLKDYYQGEGRFKPVSSGYVPKVGDVIFYDGAGWFGQHVNIVLDNQEGRVTTVGGNEAGKLRVQTRDLGAQGTLGYGLLAGTVTND